LKYTSDFVSFDIASTETFKSEKSFNVAKILNMNFSHKTLLILLSYGSSLGTYKYYFPHIFATSNNY